VNYRIGIVPFLEGARDFTSKIADWLWFCPSPLFCEYQVLIPQG